MARHDVHHDGGSRGRKRGPRSGPVEVLSPRGRCAVPPHRGWRTQSCGRVRRPWLTPSVESLVSRSRAEMGSPEAEARRRRRDPGDVTLGPPTHAQSAPRETSTLTSRSAVATQLGVLLRRPWPRSRQGPGSGGRRRIASDPRARARHASSYHGCAILHLSGPPGARYSLSSRDPRRRGCGSARCQESGTASACGFSC
jgi:hypothetical protein